MKLEDPELLRRDQVVQTYPIRIPYQCRSLYCVNGYHHRCAAATCICECHTEAAKQLAHQLGEAGALRKCYGMGCTNLVDHKNDLFCKDCNQGRTPTVRAREAKELIDNHMTRPL